LTFYLSTAYIGRVSRKNDAGVFLLIAAVVFVIAPAAALANPIGTE
jgi:hypothetical protein